MKIDISKILDIFKSEIEQNTEPFKPTLIMDDGSFQEVFSNDIINFIYKKHRSAYLTPEEEQSKESRN